MESKSTPRILSILLLLCCDLSSVGAEEGNQLAATSAADSDPQANPYPGCVKIFDGKPSTAGRLTRQRGAL